MPDLATTTSPFQQLRNAQTIHVTISGPNQFVQRRKLTPDELNKIAIAKEKWSSAKNENYDTPVIDMMCSPKKAGLIGFGFAASVGAVLTGVFTALARSPKKAVAEAFAIPTLVIAMATLPLALMNGFSIRNQSKKKNEMLEYILPRLPEGATKAELVADPIYRAEQLETIAKNQGMDSLTAGMVGYAIGSSSRR